MKYLKTQQTKLIEAERWDYDFHEPPLLIHHFDATIVKRVSDVAEIVKLKKDPTLNANEIFKYIDIASVNIETGEIERYQELTGAEAPSRARKLVQAYDIIISTCRPTRRAVAVVPEELHGQICSTGFSVIRAKENINPLYLHFALRLDSTMEQFHKFATGSSYPAILDSDVEKTLIPVPDIKEQNNIVKRLRKSLQERQLLLSEMDRKWNEVLDNSINQLQTKDFDFSDLDDNDLDMIYSHDQIIRRLSDLPSLVSELGDDEQLILDFEE